jgi:hypothetical protein
MTGAVPTGSALTVPEGAVLLHIGPYKTGTTAIQNSLAKHRADLAAHGVLYPGTDSRQRRPSWAVMRRSPLGVETVDPREWGDLVAEIGASSCSRVVISSEDFASAVPDAVERIVDDLGPDRVHVVLVMRSLATLLPSAWQQRVKTANEVRTYEEWLRLVLAETLDSSPGRIFWRNHGLDSLLRRWGARVPAERITIIVGDDADRGQQPRTFERLLGLPDGLLTPGPSQNTSLTYERCELLRLVNIESRREEWSERRRRQLIHAGMLTGVRRVPETGREHPVPPLPPWSRKRVAELSEARVESVRASGCRVVGDPAILAYRPDEERPAGSVAADDVPLTVAAAGVAGVVAAVLRAEQRRGGARRAAKPAAGAARSPGPVVDRLAGIGGRDLVRELVRRQKSRLRRRRTTAG